MERRILYLRVILMSKQVLNVEENLNHIQNSNGKLYFLCLMVGLITGIIVSFYRYALHIFNVLRETFVSPNTLTNYPFLIKLWIGFLVILVCTIGGKICGRTFRNRSRTFFGKRGSFRAVRLLCSQWNC